MEKYLCSPKSMVLRLTPSWLSIGQLPSAVAEPGPTEAGFKNWNAGPATAVIEAGAIWKARCCGTPGRQFGRGANEIAHERPVHESRSQGIPVWKVKSVSTDHPPTNPSITLFMLF